MKVSMKVNLGSRDAARFQLNHEECMEGSQPDVSDAAAEWLIATGKAEPVDATKTVRAVPDEPVAAKPKEAQKGVSEKPKK